jgi:hypothetical protein
MFVVSNDVEFQNRADIVLELQDGRLTRFDRRHAGRG